MYDWLIATGIILTVGVPRILAAIADVYSVLNRPRITVVWVPIYPVRNSKEIEEVDWQREGF